MFKQQLNLEYSHTIKPPNPQLGVSIVIPASNEPDLFDSLNCLIQCNVPRDVYVEIVVVVNDAESDASEKICINQDNWDRFKLWADALNETPFSGYGIYAHLVPLKISGVGIARKLGMDFAASRFNQISRMRGIICSFDADALCKPNYIQSIWNRFQQRPLMDGCSITFAHPLNGINQEAITKYELFLRYSVEGLKIAGHPHAFHTVGSSMAVTCQAYTEEGGMNTRKAAEDFHFLMKIIKRGRYGECLTTTVFPSNRISDRVPFGTGAAMTKFNQLESSSYPVPHPDIYQDIRSFIQWVEIAHSMTSENLNQHCKKIPSNIRSFFDLSKLQMRMLECQKNSTNIKYFMNRFFRWFDGLQSIRLVHHLRDHWKGTLPIETAANQLLKLRADTSATPIQLSSHELLMKFREIQSRDKFSE